MGMKTAACPGWVHTGFWEEWLGTECRDPPPLPHPFSHTNTPTQKVPLKGPHYI